jgi:hypothetical protein
MREGAGEAPSRCFDYRPATFTPEQLDALLRSVSLLTTDA